MADEVRKRFEGAFGAQEWSVVVPRCKPCGKEFAASSLPFPSFGSALALYQDALPICGREAEIVQSWRPKGVETTNCWPN